MSAVEPTPRLALADYQKSAVDGLLATVRKVAEIHERNPKSRRDVSLKSGVTLLQAPTGSGKTLMLGRYFLIRPWPPLPLMSCRNS